MPATGPLEDRDFVLELRNHPPTFACRTTWPVSRTPVGAAIPATVDATEFSFTTSGIQLRLDYFIQIHTD